jgi:tRNA U34 2-thiouridine synthase MnmA/TrmU
MDRKIRALGLISGGLDSTLAARLLIDQEIEVRGLYFSTGFCISDPLERNRKGLPPTVNLCHEALKVGEDLRFAVEVIDVSQEYLQIITNPRWGYGKNANPCVDCRIMMLQKAKALMPEFKADFVFTGEVIGQRPMTQHRPTLRQIEKESGLDGYLLRPLSALKLPETEVEKRGWVDRSRLKGFSGRTRKPQMALAKEFGLTSYPQPAGGCCYLTDPAYGRKFHDFLRHLRRGSQVTKQDFELLKVGRHLRLPGGAKLVVGRNEAENNALEYFKSDYTVIEAQDVVGPIALLDLDASEDDRNLAARIVARYSDGRNWRNVTIRFRWKEDSISRDVEPLPPEKTPQYLIQ